jgi:hypothetical protein
MSYITFSFNPSVISSYLQQALFNTLVVSWKDAAEINDFVCSDALVIPCKTGVPVAVITSRATTIFYYRCFNKFSSRTVLICPFKLAESPASSTISYHIIYHFER